MASNRFQSRYGMRATFFPVPQRQTAIAIALAIVQSCHGPNAALFTARKT
jgi:hypothetical protein